MQQLRSYNYVTDCVSALICVLLHGNSGEAYNLANPQSKLTIAELAKKIGEFGNCNVIFEKTNTTDVVNQSPIPKQVLNSEKIEKLGCFPASSIAFTNVYAGSTPPMVSTTMPISGSFTIV